VSPAFASCGSSRQSRRRQGFVPRRRTSLGSTVDLMGIGSCYDAGPFARAHVFACLKPRTLEVFFRPPPYWHHVPGKIASSGRPHGRLSAGGGPISREGSPGKGRPSALGVDRTQRGRRAFSPASTCRKRRPESFRIAPKRAGARGLLQSRLSVPIRVGNVGEPNQNQTPGSLGTQGRNWSEAMKRKAAQADRILTATSRSRMHHPKSRLILYFSRYLPESYHQEKGL